MRFRKVARFFGGTAPKPDHDLFTAGKAGKKSQRTRKKEEEEGSNELASPSLLVFSPYSRGMRGAIYAHVRPRSFGNLRTLVFQITKKKRRRRRRRSGFATTAANHWGRQVERNSGSFFFS